MSFKPVHEIANNPIGFLLHEFIDCLPGCWRVFRKGDPLDIRIVVIFQLLGEHRVQALHEVFICKESACYQDCCVRLLREEVVNSGLVAVTSLII